MYVDGAGDAVRWPPGQGTEEEAATEAPPPPLVVMARITGPPGTPYHNPRGFRTRLLVSPQYPAAHPEVNILQTCHHFFLDHDNGLPEVFYDWLTELVGDLDPTAPPQHTLRATVQLLVHTLQHPLHPCEGCQSQFDAYAEMHLDREATLTQYSTALRPPRALRPRQERRRWRWRRWRRWRWR